MNRAWYKGFLTKKEYEVLNLKKEGYTQKEISKRLNIKQPQVSQILSTIDEKVNRAKETLGIVLGDRVSVQRKERGKDELEVFCKIVKERVRKNVRYGDEFVEVEPW